MKKIFIEEDQVTTLAELAKGLADRYGWSISKVEAETIFFTDGCGRRCRVSIIGFAEVFEDGEWKDYDEYNINWDLDFDGWSNHVWAEDEDGNVVMLHD